MPQNKRGKRGTRKTKECGKQAAHRQFDNAIETPDIVTCNIKSKPTRNSTLKFPEPTWHRTSTPIVLHYNALPTGVPRASPLLMLISIHSMPPRSKMPSFPTSCLNQVP